MTFHMYLDHQGFWRWHLRGPQKELLAESGDAYVHRADCETSISLLKTVAAGTPVVSDESMKIIAGG